VPVTAAKIPTSLSARFLGGDLDNGCAVGDGGMMMLTYNVFRSRERDVLCAVPEDRPVPWFVSGTSWRYEGRMNDEANLPRALKVAVAFNGFYIFHAFETPETKSSWNILQEAEKTREVLSDPPYMAA
jgi:hypothetical protein